MQPAGLKHRRRGRRGRHHELHTLHQHRRVGADLHLDPKIAGEIGRTARGLRRIPAPDQRALEGAHQMCRAHLQPGLQPGADHARHGHLLGRQMPRRHGPGGGGAQVGQVAIVEKHRPHRSVLGRDRGHHAAKARQPALGIVEEPGADLEGEHVEPFDERGLGIHLGIERGQFHRHDRRHDDPAFGQCCKRAFDHIHGSEVQRQSEFQLGFGQYADVTRHRVGP